MLRLLSVCMLFVICLPVSLIAHPHVKLTTRISLVYNGKRCEGCGIEWRFDDFFSNNVIREFDKNRDGAFDSKEIDAIYKGAFTNLKNYGYFVFLRKGSVRNNPDNVTDFKAWQKDGMLFYSFFIPFGKLKYDDDFYIAIFDRSFYCATFYDKKPVSIEQKKGESPSFSVAQNKMYPVYYNPLGMSDDLTIYKKWKPGLETAYPEEIHIRFEE